MPSEVEICNAALLRIGDKTISAIDEDSKQGRACAALYDIFRDDIMARHNWNFAKARVELSTSTNTPDFEYDYTYTLPADCLRVWELYSTTSEWQREGRNLLINDEVVYLKYIKRVEDPMQFDPWFSPCLIAYLAVGLCERLVSDLELKATVINEYRHSIREAKRINAIESFGEPEDDSDSDWQEAGH